VSSGLHSLSESGINNTREEKQNNMQTKCLAPEYAILARSEDPQNVYSGSPCITSLPCGRLVVSYEWFRPAPHKEQVPDQTEILVSDDDGASWRKAAALDFIWASVFSVGDTLYMIGNRRGSRDICIARSADGGDTWSEMVTLFEGRYHCAPTPVVEEDGFVYRAFETCVGIRTEWKSLVVAGNASKDLLDPASWRMSNPVSFPEVPDVLTQHRYAPSSEDKVPYDSFLEGNVVNVRGELRVMLRTIIDGHTTPGLASVCRLEDDGREMNYRFVQFYPMPGAGCKFFIVYDERTDLFWTAVTIPTDTWQDREPLRKMGFQGPPGNERRVLVLMFSRDALNWFQAGFVAIAPSMIESFSYTTNLVRGDDLLICARTSIGGKHQHDTNLVTLHRVKNFRALVPEGF
jgi:hypothetical protein